MNEQFGFVCNRVLRWHEPSAALDDDSPYALQIFDTDLGIWLTLAQANLEDDAMAQGIPVLRGPYVVDYTDIPHDGDKKTLWTPQAGDVLLRLFLDWGAPSAVAWDRGELAILQAAAQSRVDTFTRVDAASWGTASDGQVWAAAAGNPDAAQWSISGNRGVITGDMDSNDFWAFLGAPLATRDAELCVRFRVSNGAAFNVGLAARAQHYNAGSLLLVGAGGAFIQTPVGNGPILDKGSGWCSSNTDYWMRWRVQGATHRWRIWAASQSEPSLWDQVWHDANDPGADSGSAAGLYGYPYGSTDTVAFDHFSAQSAGARVGTDGVPAVLFHTTDPVQIQLAQTGGTDPTQGHVELYALVARALAP